MMVNVTKLNLYCILILGLAIAGCSTNKAALVAKAAAPAAPVSVTQAVSKTVPLEIQAVGNVEAFTTVTVKAQIGGELTQVNFEEGADVKKGDRLFVIDPRPYESQVTQAEANLARDRAQETYARTIQTLCGARATRRAVQGLCRANKCPGDCLAGSGSRR